MTKFTREEAGAVIEALRQLHDEMDTIRVAGDRIRYKDHPEAEAYGLRLRVVKDSLKSAAKTETIDGARRPKTDLEQFFYGPTVRQASANFLMRVDASPSKWMSGLASSATDLSYGLHCLRSFVAEEAGEAPE